MELVEYRPGRLAWVEAGAVIGVASAAVAAAWRAAQGSPTPAAPAADLELLIGMAEACDVDGGDQAPDELVDVDGAGVDLDPAPVASGPAALVDAGDLLFWWALDPGDIAGSLAKAIGVFQGKATWGGARPQLVKACPALAGNGLGQAAAALGLAVTADPRVLVGTVYLGMGGGDHDAL